MPAVVDQPWRRPERLAYARERIRSFVHPPVTVYPIPDDVVQEKEVEVAMRDGVVLRVDVFRPPGPGPFPVIMCAHPYGKDHVPKRKGRGWSLNFQFRIMNQPSPMTFSNATSWEAPDPVWWVDQGYAVVNADLRGSGTSDGIGRLLSDQEAEDIHDLIEWAGAADWSTGKVGMLGVSYLAIAQYKAAALQPPSLAAICPWEGFTDAYRDLFSPGGVPERGFSVIWSTITKRTSRLSEDLGTMRKRHPLRDDWWESLTPDLERIRVPMLVCATFSDANLHSRGSFRAFENAGSQNRFAYTHRGPKWAVFYSDEAKQVQLRFFDRYLRGRDVPAPPRVRLEVRESRDTIAQVRQEREWPLERMQWRELLLDTDGGLGGDTPEAGAVSFRLRQEALAFDYTVTDDLELTGPMCATLWVSTEHADANLFVGVEKWRDGRYVPFEGSYGYGRDLVAYGRLRLALRELDEQASRPYRPVHTFRTLQPLSPGEVVPVEIPLSESSTLFHSGEKIRMLISGRALRGFNPLFGYFPSRYAASRPGRCSIHVGGEHPSRLVVPVIPSSGVRDWSV